MRIFSLFTAFAFIAGCGGSNGNAGKQDGGVADAAHQDATSSPDSGPIIQPGAIGDPCKKSGDCASGLTCLTTNFPKGYCTKLCNPNSTNPCDSNSICVNIGANYCLTNCTTPDGCRTADGYGCWIAGQTGACLPLIESLGTPVCDPTAGDGTCTNNPGGGSGACLRYRVGTGNAGVCANTCVLGTGTCPATANGSEECYIDRESDHGFGDDKFVGPVCQPVFSEAIDKDQECLFDDGSGTLHHFTNVCVDGSECDIHDPGGASIDPDGDNKCHALCYPDSQPSGANIPDGGTIAPPCNGECRKVWGDHNFGLCITNSASTADGGAQDGGP